MRGPGQSLARLPQKVDRSGSEEEKVPGPPTLPTAPVDDPPDGFEETGHPVDLVEDHQPVRVALTVFLNVRELRAVTRPLQVQVGGTLPAGEFECDGRLAHLARACQHDGGRARQQVLDSGPRFAGDHRGLGHNRANLMRCERSTLHVARRRCRAESLRLPRDAATCSVALRVGGRGMAKELVALPATWRRGGCDCGSSSWWHPSGTGAGYFVRLLRPPPGTITESAEGTTSSRTSPVRDWCTSPSTS